MKTLSTPGGDGDSGGVSPLRRTARTTLKRRPARGSYDRGLAYAILDEALCCHVGFVVDGAPCVLPMAFARWDDRLILHGARTNHMLAVARESTICATVTIVDGVVLARSAMHHSMNYRGVVVFGQPVEITEAGEKTEALRRVVEHLLPERWGATRPPTEVELRATVVLALPIEEASVKVRASGPIDDEADLALPHWAGVVPLGLAVGAPIADELHPPAAPPPRDLFRVQRHAPSPAAAASASSSTEHEKEG